jgi:hypothetical protein
MQSKTIWTAIDLAQTIGDENDFNAFEGFFKAPATGQYRFIMSCDDQCTFKINVDDPLNPEAATELLNRSSWTTYRNSDIENKSADSPDLGRTFSEWVSLVEGEHYYVEATLFNGNGNINIDVGMEIMPDVMPVEHPKMERMVQKMSLGQTNFAFDTMVVNVVNADQKAFKLNMLKPGSEDFFISGEIIAGGDAEHFKAAINDFYK